MSERVLVVDDEWQTVELVRTELARHGYEVTTAANGAECLMQIDQNRPDLVVLDVTMPVLDGYRVLEVIREKPETAGLPVIMLTAKRADQDVVRSLAKGAELHLSKPFEMAELVAAVRALLAAEGPGQGAGSP
jgi:DNA-binding response OmpR family regulator